MERYLRTGVTQPVIGDWAAPPPEGKRGFALDADHVHLTGETLLSCRAAYYGMINHLDDQISRYLMSGGVDGTTGAVSVLMRSHPASLPVTVIIPLLAFARRDSLRSII